MDWLSPRRPKRVPLDNRVKKLAFEPRQGELSVAEITADHIGQTETEVEKELVILRLDVLALGRDIDFWAKGFLAPPGLANPTGLIIRIAHIDGSCTGVYGRDFMGNSTPEDANIIYLMAYKQRTRRLKPLDITAPTQW